MDSELSSQEKDAAIDLNNQNSRSKNYWFVGAFYNEDGDQTTYFIENGIWQNGYDDKYLDLVRSIQPGDKIAIKSAYVRKNELPFDNKGYSCSVMAIKAIGTVVENQGDGTTVRVNWEKKFSPPKEWYFYTHRGTIWKINADDWKTQGLIDFTFHDTRQDINRFRNAPYWKKRFGDTPIKSQQFQWTSFYEEFATKLQAYQDNRVPLVQAIHQLAQTCDVLNVLQDQPVKDQPEPLTDICPFTVFALFNRGIKDVNRKLIAKGLADFLQVETPVPESFEGIPLVNDQKTWFFEYQYSRGREDINKLWQLFSIALSYADIGEEENESAFIAAFDDAMQIKNTGWNLTMGLYWIRPWKFLTLDTQSRDYIEKVLSIPVDKNNPQQRCSGSDYVKLIHQLETRFQEENYPVHSFPEMSLAAFLQSEQPKTLEADTQPETAEIEEKIYETYSIDNIIEDGCFLPASILEKILSQLRDKKNLILQGPPGTGKTWLAKKLAFALMGQKNENALKAVQFHANLSYEDFVRGWRPSGDGKLTLVDGPLLEMVKKAKAQPETKFVMVIEEINRGNPAQILGEMLTLLEADKRTPAEGLELSYRQYDGEKVHIPANLYVIGTMNIADRSLALMDLALRRRFAFYSLEPAFGEPWRNWVNQKSGIDMPFLSQIEQRINQLNEQIANHRQLGPQFKIGHSYLTPAIGVKIDNPVLWFSNVVESEIGPLLEEYWFDDAELAKSSQDLLTQGL